MARKLSNSLELAKASAHVLMQDKELLAFPLISGITTLLVTASFFAPAFLLGDPAAFGQSLAEPAGYVFLFLFYFIQYTVIFFFNSALVGAALIRLEGGDPTLGDGLDIALKHIRPILAYAAVAATVGMILRMLSERLGWLGRILVGLAGMSWTLATFLVVPVLVTRDVGPWQAVKDSASLFRKTWGEHVAGNVGLGLAFGLMFGSLTLFAVPALILASRVGSPVLPAVAILVVAAYVLLGLASAAMSGIYSAALYRYATTGETGGAYSPWLLRNAFGPKEPRF